MPIAHSAVSFKPMFHTRCDRRKLRVLVYWGKVHVKVWRVSGVMKYTHRPPATEGEYCLCCLLDLWPSFFTLTTSVAKIFNFLCKTLNLSAYFNVIINRRQIEVIFFLL